MKLDEISKRLYEELSFDEILDPDLTEEEQIEYYENILEESIVEQNKEKEDKIVAILNDMLSEDEKDE